MFDAEGEFSSHEHGLAGLGAAEGIVRFGNVSVYTVFLRDYSERDILRDSAEHGWVCVSVATEWIGRG